MNVPHRAGLLGRLLAALAICLVAVIGVRATPAEAADEPGSPNLVGWNIQDGNLNIGGAPSDGGNSVDISKTYGSGELPWHSQAESIDQVYFVGDVAPTSMAYWFQDTHVFNIDGKGLDTSHVTTLAHCFDNCSVSFFTCDLSSWDVSSVTDMSGMFQDCSYLLDIYLTGWDTSSVTNTSNMFNYCRALRTADLTGWDTSSVTDMSWMFSFCGSLISVEGLSDWNISSVTDLSDMFIDCEALPTLDLAGWAVPSGVNMNEMLKDCMHLATIWCDHAWGTPPDPMLGAAMFLGCEALASTSSGMTYADWRWDSGDATTLNPVTGYFTATGLKVSMAVAGEGASDQQAFQVTVTLQGDDAEQVNGLKGTTDQDAMSFEGGVATFTLKAGESKVATGLPANLTYAITEAPVDGYAASFSGGGVSPTGTGTIADGTIPAVPVTNTRTAASEPPIGEPDTGQPGTPGTGAPSGGQPTQTQTQTSTHPSGGSALPETGDDTTLWPAVGFATLAMALGGAGIGLLWKRER